MRIAPTPFFTSVVALTVALAGCAPDAPTEGRFGCTDGSCPDSHPFCHDDLRCYSTAEVARADTGPRPDSGARDAGLGLGRYASCRAGDTCLMPFTCVHDGMRGYCLQSCVPPAMCVAGTVCAPMRLPGTPSVCLDNCRSMMCPLGSVARSDMGGAICHCVPMGSGW